MTEYKCTTVLNQAANKDENAAGLYPYFTEF